jgi:hypothetical protein
VLSVILSNVVMLSIILLNVIMLNVILLNVVLLSVVWSNVIMMSVVVPKKSGALYHSPRYGQAHRLAMIRLGHNIFRIKKVCQIFDFVECIWLKVEESFSLKRNHQLSNFPPVFTGQGFSKMILLFG